MNEYKQQRVFNFETKFNVPIPPSQRIAFERTPLISPSRLLDWGKVFAPVVRPSWARTVQPLWINPDDDEKYSFPEAILFVVGKKHPRMIRTSTVAFAVISEILRFGHRIVTNHNGKRSVYARISFDGAPEDLTSLLRFIFGAKANEVTKVLWQENDYSPENIYSEEHGNPDKDARAVTLRHVEGLARERETAGTLPKGFDIDAYLTNITTLLAIIDDLLTPENADLEGSFAKYMARQNGEA